jgi:hypothetical protein
LCFLIEGSLKFKAKVLTGFINPKPCCYLRVSSHTKLLWN